MFEEQRQFNFFDYEGLSKDFCYMKPICVHYETGDQSSRCEVDHLLEVKNYKCTVHQEIKVEKRFGFDKVLRVGAGDGFLKFYGEYLLPKQSQRDIEQNQSGHAQKPGNVSPQAKTGSNEEVSPLGEDRSVYTTVYSDRKLQNASFQVGIHQESPNTIINANLTSFLNPHKNDYFLYGKFIYRALRWNLGFLSIVDFGNKNLQTNNVVLELKPHEKHSLFVRAQVDGLRNYSLNYKKIQSYFDFLFANYMVKPSKSLTLMAQLKYDVTALKIKYVSSLIEKQFSSRKLKLRMSNLPDVTLQYQCPLFFTKDSTMDFGIRFSELFKNMKISYGFRFNLNF